MSARRDMLAGLALAGLCASPRSAQGADPHDDAQADGAVRRALALADKLADKLDAEGHDLSHPAPFTAADAQAMIDESVRATVREMLEDAATAPAPAPKAKRG